MYMGGCQFVIDLCDPSLAVAHNVVATIVHKKIMRVAELFFFILTKLRECACGSV